MTNYKRTWIKVFTTLFLLIPGLPYVLLALVYLFNRIGLQGLLITPWKIILHAYFALPALIFGKGLYPESSWGYGPGLGGLVVAAILYSLIAFGLAFPISRWLEHSRAKKLKEGPIKPLDSGVSTASPQAHKKSISIKKRIVITGTIIALILAALFATKAMLIQYHLFRFRQITEANIKDFSIERMKTSVNPFVALSELGYLTTYSIPIQNPRSDAETRLELLHMVMLNHGIPASVIIENRSGTCTLEVGDRPIHQKGWETFVRLYLEAPKGQQAGAGYVAQGAPSPDP